jgi:hypothetical protein
MTGKSTPSIISHLHRLRQEQFAALVRLYRTWRGKSSR